MNPVLKKEIENFLKSNNRALERYQNLKGFIDNACRHELDNVKNELKK